MPSEQEAEAVADVLQKYIAIRYTREFMLSVARSALEAAERVRKEEK